MKVFRPSTLYEREICARKIGPTLVVVALSGRRHVRALYAPKILIEDRGTNDIDTCFWSPRPGSRHTDSLYEYWSGLAFFNQRYLATFIPFNPQDLTIWRRFLPVRTVDVTRPPTASLVHYQLVRRNIWAGFWILLQLHSPAHCATNEFKHWILCIEILHGKSYPPVTTLFQYETPPAQTYKPRKCRPSPRVMAYQQHVDANNLSTDVNRLSYSFDDLHTHIIVTSSYCTPTSY